MATLTGGLLVLLVVAAVVLVLRRKVLHPLGRFPGPLLNSLTHLPAAIHMARGTQQFYYKKLHERYGPVVRVAPDELSFVGARAWDDIYGFRRPLPNMEKSAVFIGAVAAAPDGSVGISMAPLASKDHARQRGAMAYCYTNGALLQQQDIMKTHIDKLVARLREMPSSEPVDMANWYTYATFDLMGDLTFAQPFGCLDAGGATDWSKAIMNVFVSGAWEQAIRRVCGVNTPLTRLATRLLVPRAAAQWRRTHLLKSTEVTQARLRDGLQRNHPDVIHQILKNKASRNAMTDTEIVLNAVLLISAGSETTAGTLTAWTYFFCTEPGVRARVLAEIRGSGLFQSEDDIVWDRVQPASLPYLEATLHETLRLFSPAAASQQRIVPAGGATIDGHFVPAGTCVATSPYACTRMAANFKDPDAFRPERWLGDSQYKDDVLAASKPFGTGPRVCLGQNLAWFELRLIITRLVWNFDMELDHGPLGRESNKLWGMDMRHIKGYLTWTKPPLWVRVKARAF